MAKLKMEGKGQMWGTWIPTKPDLSEGISLLARDLQGTMIVYDQGGNLYGAVREGMVIPINGVNLKVLELLGSTGLQIKADPGIPLVYLGFGLLMLGVMMSYLSHSQIWALEEGDRFYLGGKTNRAQVSFEREIIEIIESLKKVKSPVLDT
jgi:cytochrome c biogenesis protein